MFETKERGSFCGFLGIDISKRTFDGCCIDSGGAVLFSVSLPMNRTGFEKLVDQVGAISLPKGSILVGMESTACYHVSLFAFLMALGYRVLVINSLLISNFLKLQLRKTKTDKKDAAVLIMKFNLRGEVPTGFINQES